MEIKYNEAETLEKIKDIKYPLLSVPFHGTPVFVKVRELTQTQIQSCGDFSLIETFEDKIRMKEKPKRKELIAFAERQHNITRESLVSPTYDQIFETVGIDPKVKEKIKLLEELKLKLASVKSLPERSAIEESIDSLKVWIYYLLPNDFTSYLTCFALQIDKTDIKKVSEKMLLDAAILAVNGHDNPADHIDGLFTSFNKDDINRRAWGLYAEWKKNRGIKRNK